MIPRTLTELLSVSSEQYAGRPALRVKAGLRDQTWTYADLTRAANSIAHELRHGHGLRVGDRVVFWGPNCPQLVGAYFGAMLARAVVVPLDASSTKDFAERVARETEARMVISGFPSADGSRLEGTRSLFDLPFDAERPPVGDPPAEHDLAEIVFTSGTTARPKGVMLTHRNITANVMAARQLLPERPHRLVSLLPLSHMLEQTVGLFVPLVLGSSITYARGDHPRTVLAAMRRSRATAMVLVPQLLELMLRRIELGVAQRGQEGRWQRAHRLANRLPMWMRRQLFRDVLGELGGRLEMVVCGGANLPTALARTWERLGVRVLQGYGSTECAPIVACNSYWHRSLDSVGPPLRGARVQLSPEGEVLVRGDNVTSG